MRSVPAVPWSWHWLVCVVLLALCVPLPRTSATMTPNTYSLVFNTHGTSHLQVSSTTIQNMVATFSASVWFKTAYDPNNYSVTGDLQSLIGVGNGVGGWAFLLRNYGSGAIRGLHFVAYGIQDYPTSPGATITSDTWHHAAFVFDSSYDVRFFYDGSLWEQVNGGQASISATNNNFMIGESFWGQVDEVSLFNVALSDTDITTIWNGGVPGDLTSLSPMGWWRMGEDSASFTSGTWTIPDASGNGYDVSGTTFLSSDRRLDIPGTSTSGSYYDKYSLFFDGTQSGVVSNPTNILALTNDFSISIWFKLPFGVGRIGGTPISRLISTDSWFFALHCSTAVTNDPFDEILFGRDDGSQHINTKNVGTSVLITNVWHHVLLTYSDTNVINVWFDGGNLGSTAAGGPLPPPSSSILYVGVSADDFKGQLDDVVIFGKTLTSTEIGYVYNTGTPSNEFMGSVGSMFGYWRMGDGSATYSGGSYTIPDESGHGYQLIMTANSNQKRLDAPGVFAFVGIVGDPVFYGFQGQHFEVHGLPNEYFTLWTTPTVDINARFVYLDEHTHDSRKQSQYVTWTTKWTHAGTYLDQIGVIVCGQHILIEAGSWKRGLKVTVQGEEMSIGSIPITVDITNATSSSCRVIVQHPSHETAIITQPGIFSWSIINAHHFVNLQASLLLSQLRHAGAHSHRLDNHNELDTMSPYPDYPLHGLIGNTWRNATYPQGHAYQGSIMDYLIQPQPQHTHESLIWSTNSYYSLYSYDKQEIVEQR